MDHVRGAHSTAQESGTQGPAKGAASHCPAPHKLFLWIPAEAPWAGVGVGHPGELRACWLKPQTHPVGDR